MVLENAFSWPCTSLRALIDLVGAKALRDSALCANPKIGTYFSGIGSPELAGEMISNAAFMLGMSTLFQFAFSCDCSKACQHELILRTSGCVFRDVLSRLPAFTTVGFDAEELWGKVQTMTVRNTADCARHSCDACPCGAVEGVIAGSPCQDWSSSGKKAGLGGSRIHLFLAWCRIMLHEQPPWIVHENVSGFPMWLMSLILGDAYYLYPFYVDPADAGFHVVRRPRLYIVLLHKHKCELVYDIYEVYNAMKHACTQIVTNPSDAILADPTEVWSETMELCARRCLPIPTQPQFDMFGQWSLLSFDELKRNTRLYELWEESHLIPAHRDSLAILSLGDSPDTYGPNWSASGRIPTLRRNSYRLWAAKEKRFLTLKERCAIMGWPVYPELALSSMTETLPIPSGGQSSIGNMMHVANVGMIMIATLVSIRVSPPDRICAS